MEWMKSISSFSNLRDLLKTGFPGQFVAGAYGKHCVPRYTWKGREREVGGHTQSDLEKSYVEEAPSGKS